jgi:hypothetical protein
VGRKVQDARSRPEAAWVPFPWWTSVDNHQRSRPCLGRARDNVLFNERNPIARSGVAWCPGGRMAAKPCRNNTSRRSATPPRRRLRVRHNRMSGATYVGA